MGVHEGQRKGVSKSFRNCGTGLGWVAVHTLVVTAGLMLDWPPPCPPLGRPLRAAPACRSATGPGATWDAGSSPVNC